MAKSTDMKTWRRADVGNVVIKIEMVVKSDNQELSSFIYDKLDAHHKIAEPYAYYWYKNVFLHLALCNLRLAAIE